MTCCANNKCDKKDTCERYNNIEYAEIKFANICDIENDYKWFWEKEIVKESIENNTEDKTINE